MVDSIDTFRKVNHEMWKQENKIEIFIKIEIKIGKWKVEVFVDGQNLSLLFFTNH